jgi:hypothetical protein
VFSGFGNFCESYLSLDSRGSSQRRPLARLSLHEAHLSLKLDKGGQMMKYIISVFFIIAFSTTVFGAAGSPVLYEAEKS